MLRFVHALLALGLLVALESSCRKRRVDVPLSTPPASAPSGSPPAEQSRPVTAIPRPAPVSPSQPPAPPQEEPKYQVNRPSQSAEPQPQQTPPRRPSRGSEPAAQPPVSPAPATESPRLGDVLTPEQERQYNAAIDQSLTHAQSSLSTITNRRLTKEQQAVVAQIQSFVQQAQTTRKSNLPAARSLSERAEVLARDLAGSLR
jgi:hypothetical protein